MNKQISLVLAALSLAAAACGDFGAGGFHPVVTGPPKPAQATVIQMVLDMYDAGHLEHPPVQWIETSTLDCKTGPAGEYVAMPLGTGEGWTKQGPTRCVYGDTVTRHLPGGYAEVRYLRLVWRAGYMTAADAAPSFAHELAHIAWPGDGGHKMPHWHGTPSRVEQVRDAVYAAFPQGQPTQLPLRTTEVHEDEVELVQIEN